MSAAVHSANGAGLRYSRYRSTLVVTAYRILYLGQLQETSAVPFREDIHVKRVGVRIESRRFLEPRAGKTVECLLPAFLLRPVLFPSAVLLAFIECLEDTFRGLVHSVLIDDIMHIRRIVPDYGT